MAHKTLIGGTAYEISGGKTLVGSTAYSIDKGKTLVDGTVYDISFFSLPALRECTPAQVQAAAQSGQAPNFWAVGDMIGIYLNGTVEALTLSGTYYAFIIGFNHNSGIEGSNTIHFQFGKTSDGVDISFVDSHYSERGITPCFCMNPDNTKLGGWKACYMRETICPTFKSIMPTAWQNVIAACTKYSDNVGDCTDTASNVTATSDDIFCLAEFEVFGAQTNANSAEKNYQKQYDYYKNGNSRKKYKHSATTTSSYWWLRSVSTSGTKYSICYVSEGGAAYSQAAYASRGFAPGFMVA